MGLVSFLKRAAGRRVGGEHREFVEMSGSLLGGLQARCPVCRRGRLMPDPQAMNLRICDEPSCGASLGLTELGRIFAVGDGEVEALAANERQQAMVLMVAAEILLVIGAAWAVWTGSWLTLGGALLLAIVIVASALVARYRAWQIENGRMFERTAPFGEFLRFELGALLARR